MDIHMHVIDYARASRIVAKDRVDGQRTADATQHIDASARGGHRVTRSWNRHAVTHQRISDFWNVCVFCVCVASVVRFMKHIVPHMKHIVPPMKHIVPPMKHIMSLMTHHTHKTKQLCALNRTNKVMHMYVC